MLNQDFIQLDVQHFAERMTVRFSGGQQSFRLFGTIGLHPPLPTVKPMLVLAIRDRSAPHPRPIYMGTGPTSAT